MVSYFCLDFSATQIAALTGLTRKSVNVILAKMRHRIACFCDRQSPLTGDIEVDESYFGAHRVRGKRGRGAAGKTPVFGILKRNGQVYTQIVPNCRRSTLQSIIKGKVTPDSVIHSDGWKGYDGLVDVGFSRHYRINHSDNEFASGANHINGIESFWSFAKRRLMKFNGIPNHTFNLHLKECEFRFNQRNANMYRVLLSILRKYPL